MTQFPRCGGDSDLLGDTKYACRPGIGAPRTLASSYRHSVLTFYQLIALLPILKRCPSQRAVRQHVKIAGTVPVTCHNFPPLTFQKSVVGSDG